MTFWDRGQSLQQKEIDVTHSLTPAPITRHYIMETVVTVEVVLLMRDVVEFIAEVQILKHVVDQFVRISKHPIWSSSNLLHQGGGPCWVDESTD